MGVSVPEAWEWELDNSESGDGLTSFDIGKLLNHLVFSSVEMIKWGHVAKMPKTAWSTVGVQ